jgi:CBS domain-containing protein
MKVSEIMSRPVTAIDPKTTIGEAARLMGEKDIGVLPVIDGGRLAGIVTDRDIAVRGVACGVQPDTSVTGIMTEKVGTCSEDEDVDDVLERMADLQVRRMPVRAQDGRVTGLFSIGDAAREDKEEEEVAQALRGICRPWRRHPHVFFAA